MSVSNISSMMRMTGLSSGLDVDSLVQQLMKAESSKLDKLKQQRQVQEWKRDQYRDIMTSLKGFSSDYFDILKPSSNMRSTTAFSSFTTTYGSDTTSPYLTAAGSSTAKAGSYTIKDIVTATAASNTSASSLSGGMTGSDITGFNISAASDNNKIKITLNGNTQEITLDNVSANINTLVSNLQSKIDAAFGTIPNTLDPANPLKKITVGNTGNQLTFATDQTNSMSVDYAYNTGLTTVLGKAITSPVTLDDQNNKFKVTLGGATKDIVLSTGTYNDSSQLQTELQNKINAAFGSSPEAIRVLNQGNVLSIRAIGSTSVTTSGSLTGVPIGNSTVVDNTNKDITVTLGTGTPTTISLDTNATGYTKTDLLANIQSKLDAAYGANKVMASLDGSNNLRFESVDTTTLSATAKENGGLDAIGLSSVNKSNKIDISSNLYDIKDNFATALNVTGASDDIQFSINGSTFKFSSKSTSLNTIIATVNSDATANVIMEYNQVYDKITVRSKQMGATSQVALSDTSGGLLINTLKLTAPTAGRDASMTYNDGSGTGDQQVIRSSNSFNFNGIGFELKKDNAGPITVNIGGDSSKVVDLVKGFVSKYNDLIDKVNTKLTETKNRSYLPLTDDQKSAMKDSDITNWEAKAKSGLLRSDSLLSTITDKMRTALSDNIYVDSTDLSSKIPLSLASIGITTSSDYTQRGKLIIDEDKLKAAITTNPDGVVQLFTKDDSGISYTDSLNDSAKRSERYKESGIAQRLYDILQDNIRTTRDSDGKKGILLEKAGMIGDISEFTCAMYKEIGDYDTKISEQIDLLNDKETRYYQKFSNLETMLSKMNSQGNWLSSQLGSK